MDEKRMAGSYEIIHALRIGDREVVLGYDPENKDGNHYMTAFCEENDLFIRYDEVLASPNYAETVELFANRIATQAHRVREQMEAEQRNVTDNRAYDSKRCEVISGCKLVSEADNLNGQVIIIKPEILREEYRTAAHQLHLCTGGFGTYPNARGSAVFCTNLYDGSKSRFERSDVLAILDRSAVPEWAEKQLSEFKKSEHQKARKGEAL